MHTLVEVQHLTRKELLRGLVGLSDEDACRSAGRINPNGWIVGHLSWLEHAIFVAGPRCSEVEPEYRVFAMDSPPSIPRLGEVIVLWHAACEVADVWLNAATEKNMLELFTVPIIEPLLENAGTLLARNIFHDWCHIDEISAIRQIGVTTPRSS